MTGERERQVRRELGFDLAVASRVGDLERGFGDSNSGAGDIQTPPLPPILAAPHPGASRRRTAREP